VLSCERGKKLWTHAIISNSGILLGLAKLAARRAVSRWAGHGCGSPRLAQVYLCSFGFRQGYHLSPEILLHQ
jgi:hypothetical protein